MPLFDRKIRSLALIIAGFLLLFLGAGIALWLSMQQQTGFFLIRHTLEIENQISRVQLLITDTESGQRGFILTGRDNYLGPFLTARRQIMPEIEVLAHLTADNPNQQEKIESLRTVTALKLNQLDTLFRLRSDNRTQDALDIINDDSGAKMMGSIRSILTSMRAEEERLLQKRSLHAAQLTRFTQAALIVCAILVLLIAIVVLRDGYKRLADLEKSNEKLQKEVSERASAEGQLRQLQKMEAIGQLTGGIAHDFNNMLAIVIGSLDMARRRLAGTEHPNIAKCLDNATEGAQRAALLTARLLAFSRQQPLDPKVLDANKLVGGMSELLRRTIGEAIRIETVLAGGLWRVCADPVQVESALVNLAVNARDAMPDGGKLTIETANTDLDDRYARNHSEVKAGQYVMISVTDTGTGMGPEVMERAFDPFYTTKGAGKGTGLGLSQVFGFVKQSGGHVKIYSEIGHGTTIKMYLSRYTGNETVSDQTATKLAELPKGHVDEIILVVEDEAQVRHISVDALRELGYTVVQAVGPNEALQQLELQPSISMMFTDIIMPDMTGRQLADKALIKRPDLKVLYTTGYTRNAVVHNGVLDSGTAFLAKPFTVEQLARKIREVLDQNESTQDIGDMAKTG